MMAENSNSVRRMAEFKNCIAPGIASSGGEIAPAQLLKF